MAGRRGVSVRASTPPAGLPLLAAGLSLAVLAGCATARPEPSEPAPLGEGPTPIVVAPEASAPVAKAPSCDAFVRPGVIRRSAVARTIDAGIGRWLAGGVEVDRKIAKGRFQGWTVKRLYAGDPCYREVDLRPGDVVVQVNGKSIEKPEQAHEVFTALRTEPSLVVDYLRDGQPQRLTLAIAND